MWIAMMSPRASTDSRSETAKGGVQRDDISRARDLAFRITRLP